MARLWKWIFAGAVVVGSAAACWAQGAEVSGRIEMQGPKRSLVPLQIMLRPVGRMSFPAKLRAVPQVDGSFRFQDVPEGVYVLQVEGARVMRAEWGAQGPELAGRAVVVHAGETIRDLVVPVMARPVLCGRVFGLDGKPLANAEVHAWQTDAQGVGGAQGGGNQEGVMMGGNVTADAEGRYRLSQMIPGYYVVAAYTPEHSAEAATGYWKNGADREDAATISLVADGKPDVCPYDLHTRAPQKIKPYAGPRFRVEGELAEPMTTARLAGRKLRWMLVPEHASAADTVNHYEVFDAASPKFDFAGVMPGQYRLFLDVPFEGGSYSGECFSFVRPPEVIQTITVTGDVHRVEAALVPVATVHGTIEEVHTPQDVRQKRDPKDGAYVVELNQWERQYCSAAVPEEDGSFRFEDLYAPGSYTFDVDTAVRGSVDGMYTSRVEWNGSSVGGGKVQLQPGENVFRVTVRFDSGTLKATLLPAVNVPPGTLSSSAMVLLLNEDGERMNFNHGAYKGVFEDYLPPGRYTGIACWNDDLNSTWGEDRWSGAALLKAVAALGTPFEVKAGETTSVTLVDRTVEMQDLSAKMGMLAFWP